MQVQILPLGQPNGEQQAKAQQKVKVPPRKLASRTDEELGKSNQA